MMLKLEEKDPNQYHKANVPARNISFNSPNRHPEGWVVEQVPRISRGGYVDKRIQILPKRKLQRSLMKERIQFLRIIKVTRGLMTEEKGMRFAIHSVSFSMKCALELELVIWWPLFVVMGFLVFYMIPKVEQALENKKAEYAEKMRNKAASVHN